MFIFYSICFYSLDYIQPVVDEHKANFNCEKVNDFIDEYLLAQQQQKDYFTVRAKLIYNQKWIIKMKVGE